MLSAMMSSFVDVSQWESILQNSALVSFIFVLYIFNVTLNKNISNLNFVVACWLFDKNNEHFISYYIMSYHPTLPYHQTITHNIFTLVFTSVLTSHSCLVPLIYTLLLDIGRRNKLWE